MSDFEAASTSATPATGAGAPTRGERIGIDESVMPIYRELVGEPGKSGEVGEAESAPFATLKDVFMMAACVGHRLGTRRPLPSGAKTQIRREVFTEADMALLKAIAIADTGDVQVLMHLGEVLTIAEEHAHAGIHELKRHLLDQPGRPLWNLVELVST